MQKENSKVNILISGGAGFIGSHLVDLLLEMGYSVTVLDNLINGSEENLSKAKNHSSRFEFIQGDILDSLICFKIMKNIDYVFHLACLGVRHSIHSPLENHKVNAEGTLNLLTAAKNNDIKHFFIFQPLRYTEKQYPFLYQNRPLQIQLRFTELVNSLGNIIHWRF